jgi:hypothetical protein
MLRRHPDIHHRQLRPQPAGQLQQPGRLAGLPDDLEPGAVKQAGQALARSTSSSASTTRVRLASTP